MAFLFGKKKGTQNREGTPTGTSSTSGATPPSSANNSLSNLPAGGETGSPNSRNANTQSAARTHQSQNSDGATVSPQQGRILPQQPQSPPQQLSSNASLYPWAQRRLTLNAQHPSPFPRYGHAANAVGSKDGDVYIMGGLIRSANVRGDLWMVEGGSDRLEAYPVLTTSEGPGPRVGHASLLVGNAFIVFGGDTKLDERDLLDETLYLLNTSTRQWSRASPQGRRPSGRYGHTLNILGSKLYIFGGQVDTVFFNDLVAFDLNTLQHPDTKWEVLVPDGDGAADVPASRTNHTIVTWNDKLYLFGGTNGAEWFNDVWSYDHRTNSWTQLDCIGFIPSPREGHAAALVGDVMYIFGGRSADGTDLGDLAAFRISSRRWYTFQNMGPSPSPRSGHSMTSVGQKIVVLGGEPSVQQRPQEELQLVYVLDTGKIRYPNDNPAQISPTERNQARGDPRRGAQGMRSASAEGAGPGPDGRRLPKQGPRESLMGSSPPPAGSTPPLAQNNTSGGSGGSRLPRASMSVTPAGPPPTQQAPPPRANGVMGPNKTPIIAKGKENAPQGQAPQSAVGLNGRRTPTNQRKGSNGSMERSRSRQHQGQGSVDSITGLAPVEEIDSPDAAQAGQQPLQQQNAQRPTIDVRAPSDQPTIPHPGSPIRPSNEAKNFSSSPVTERSTGVNTEEVQKLKRMNDWYASELALARRAGYTPQTNSSTLLEDRGGELPENERPFLEAMLALKGELAKVQGEVENQAALAAKRVQDVERQRDVAIQEAVYAKAKLAALGGPAQSPTPGDRTHDIDIEKMTDMSRKLAASLSAQADLSAKVSVLSQEIASEKKARHLADETASAAQARIAELDKYRNGAGSEVESLRAELLDAEKAFREEAAKGQEAAADARMLRIDQEELTAKLQDVLQQNRDYQASLQQLSKAMQLTNSKCSTLERQLEEERVTKEGLERKLAQVRSEYEEKSADLHSVNQRLKDVEELMSTYAEEAKAAQAVLSAGVGKLGERDVSSLLGSLADERVRVLTEQVASTKALLSKSKQQADETGEKLAEAMQRIAGLEYQQGQSSKDSIALRRRMAEVGDEGRRLKHENAELIQRVNDKQLEVDSVSAKLHALKEILQERGGTQSALDKRRSILQSPSPQSGSATPEQALRLRELEARLEDSLRAHRETKNTAEMQAQEVEKHFREKLEQLEQDYQSAVHYVKGTEKMLKRMNEQLSKFKAQNIRLQTELEEAQRRASKRDESRNENEADWEQERDLLNAEIDELRSQVRESATALDKQIRETKEQLDTLREERDDFRIKHSEIKLELIALSEQLSDNKGLVEKLEGENQLLENRAQSAEQKVSMLLDQVENSVDAYRRSTLQGANGDSPSVRSSYYGGPDNRTSVALDSLATELDQLRTHWETTNKSYRLSNAFDFEKSPTSPQQPNEFTSSIAQWRQKLHQEEEVAARSASGSRQEAVSPISPMNSKTEPRNGIHPTPATAQTGGLI